MTKAEPIAVAQRIAFGDCDIVGIVYTGRLLNYGVEAIDEFYKQVVGRGWFEFCTDHKLATPFVNVTVDFRKPATPRDKLICHVAPTRLGRTSIVFSVVGRQNDAICFEGSYTCVFTSMDTLEKQAPPDWLAKAIAPWVD
ncbi:MULTISPECIES: acyl-CoA thioesterase [Roseobacteraceae]|jgi:YbgC/YbaW family acyl-CoA thioester hydrolase|uniref:Thioesterase superfamily protein n=1 Tax=Celeribacter baekdonensis B30 TaxID=1208323 RepID=K2IG86_9RHOB|nr:MULTISPECIES: acyl-CoA thioesterase [Roseobacteraceae]EKE69096.1 thioesterase superfamily protein [Celeribacter baekdonensis B30]KAB6715146.1 acyl-CoA thioesterase [Roseobacter sp. TSBP12]|tara:strand:+ start:3195 stop:3614 length:420 start_codon:yes stop_codon:yes gene_type:complete